MTPMPITLATPLDLPCGARLSNRIGKAPMTEGLADGNNHATPELVHLYKLWSEGGAGLLISGNVLVDRRYLERPANVAIEDRSGLEQLKAFAAAGTSAGNHLWMQINHAGRQTPTYTNPEPVGPSAVQLELPKGYGVPRALTGDEIEDVIRRFTLAAEVAAEAGFTGVQVHAAHGYLLSEFLSPKANQRDDDWGGNLENRARLLLEIVKSMRAVCGGSFPVSVKLNSADFQKGGFTHQDCLQVVQWLEAAGVDLLEISGGTYEQPSMMGARAREQIAENVVKESTRQREAYFLDYAHNMRQVLKTMPLMVTGGFRSRAGMTEALESGDLDVVGIGRPMCVDTDLPLRLLDGSLDEAGRYEAGIVPPKAGLAWFCLQLIKIGRGETPDTGLDGETAIEAYKESELAAAAAMHA
jgi:2,4-dienoyl-CoA reductase-like NADH-dependent reductase (Old Yellow Enzyme family)